MASSSEHQGLQIAVIIFALLTIVMSGATFYVFKLSEDAELRAAEANRKDAESTTALTNMIKDKGEILKMMGTKYAAMGADPKLEDIQAIYDADMAKYANTLIKEKQAYADALEEAKLAHLKVTEDLSRELDRVNQLAATVAAETQAKQDNVEKHRQEAVAAQDQTKDATNKFKEDRDKLNADMKQFADDLAAEKAARADAEQKYVKAAKDAADRIDALTNLNEDKQKDLDELREKTFVAADGEIVWVSPQTNTVWINVGRDDGLKKHVTFSVYGLDQNGVARGEPKGSIEVTQVLGAHRAEAKIIEDNLSDPILIRDQLYTPLWHPGRTEQFAICGVIDIDKDGVTDVGFIKDLIRRHGGEWVAELNPDGSINAPGEGMTLNTRYLIQGEPFPSVDEQYGAMLKEAKRLGVETLSLEKFLDYIGWKETAKVVNFGRDADPKDFMYDPNQDRARRPAASSAGANNFRRRTPPKAAGSSAYSDR